MREEVLGTFHYLSSLMTAQIAFKPIGTVSTEFRSKYGAPRQPGTATRPTIGIIRLEAGHNFEQALSDLIGFEYIWVIFWFNRNTNWKPMVLPPHGGRIKRGVFATRSPHRPNPIGLSLCKLIDVKGRTIRIENPDMLDGTPILDIKPYLPHAESIPGARSGWIGQEHELTSRKFKVSFSRDVRAAMRRMEPRERREITEYLKNLLGIDPFPHVYRRIKQSTDGTSVIAVRRWRFLFTIDQDTVHVRGLAYVNDVKERS